MSYKKKYINLPAAISEAGCDIDALLEAGAEREFRVFVKANRWTTKGGRVRTRHRISGYVEIAKDALVQARSESQVLVSRCKLSNGKWAVFEAEHAVFFGAVFVLTEEIARFRAKYSTPIEQKPPAQSEGADLGMRASLNLTRTIGLLAHFIAHNMGKSRHVRAKKPNAKQLALDLDRYLDTNRLTRKGFSESSLHKRIVSGLRALGNPDE